MDQTNKLDYSYWRDTQTTATTQKPEAIEVSGLYYINKGTTNNGCAAINPVSVVITPPIKIPDAFSPNNDGINDTWEIAYLTLYQTARIQIYNRYGQPSFKSNGSCKAWNGKLNGKYLPMGTYYYLI